MDTLVTMLGQFWFAPGLSWSQFSLLLASGVGGTMCLSVVGFCSVYNSRRARQTVRRKVEGAWESTGAAVGSGSASPLTEGLVHSLTFLGRLTQPRRAEALSRLRRRLLQGGYRAADAVILFLGVKLLLALVLPGVYLWVRPSGLGTLPVSSDMCILLGTALVGFYAPELWLRMHVQRRTRQIFEGFPDALDLLVVCVEAGLGLEAAIQRVGQALTMHRALHEELALVDVGLRAGQTRQVALRNLALRIDLEEVKQFVAVLVQTDRFGTSVAQTLRVHADAMRLKRRQRAEERAMKIPIKLLFPLIFGILPSLLVVIVGPAVLRVFRTLLPLMTRS